MKFKKSYKMAAIKRVSFSVMITIIYLFGSNIALPGVNLGKLTALLKASPNMAMALSMTGISLDQFSVFSLGVGPWMSALIFWRVLTVTKAFNVENLTLNQSYMVKFSIALMMGVIQGIGILYNVQLDNNSLTNYIMLLIIILGGLSFLIWLGNLNTRLGVGSSTVIILITMSKSWIGKFINYMLMHEYNWQFIIQIVLVTIAIILLTRMIVFFFNAQLRLPLMRVMLNSKYATKSYLPIPMNPAGGMPYMYAFTIMSLPQYFLAALKTVIKGNTIIDQLYFYLRLDHIVGACIMIIVIVFLSIAFAYVNVDPKEISEKLRDNGDYFIDVYPGKNTEKYLSDKILNMAIVGAVYNAIMIGLPMIMSIYMPSMRDGYQIITIWLMWTILFQEILRQFFGLYNMGKNKKFIEFN